MPELLQEVDEDAHACEHGARSGFASVSMLPPHGGRIAVRSTGDGTTSVAVRPAFARRCYKGAMVNNEKSIWLAAGVRTPFVGVDGRFAHRDSLSLSVPVVQAMAEQSRGSIDFGIWGAVIPNLAYANLAREVWLEAKLDPHVPTFTTIMQCSTSMLGVFEAAEMLVRSRTALALVGGVESMSRVQIGLGQNLSDWLRRVVQARNLTQRTLSQAVNELADLPKSSRAIVSICADGGLGTVALLEN